MTVRLIWRCNSDMPHRQDAFWVACTAAEVDSIIVPALDQTARVYFEEQRHALSSDQFARANPQLAEPGRWNFLVSRDGTTIQPQPAHLPYGGQWNSWNPFEPIGPVDIASLAELRGVAPTQTYEGKGNTR